ncbi:MAG TPA: DUF1097 domain-containing protein, partial [Polyangiaceae bacterium]
WKSGAVNLGCVLIGVCLGMTAQFVLGMLSTPPGLAEQIASVFAVTWVVLSLRFVPKFNNVPALFLGSIAYFASRLAPGWATFATLAGAVVLGATAASLTGAAQARWFGADSVSVAEAQRRTPHAASV